MTVRLWPKLRKKISLGRAVLNPEAETIIVDQIRNGNKDWSLA